ncbi:NAD(P)/FAD-dependent oxidoreductase [Streptomyces sp. NPDC051940]|uniref:NAD(P)/FAD-dependent oxidoreductase n=1 Tax=Streptomyces sp. NPDC051940 TaxID=3155675 RepID=UPI00341D604B
MTRYDVIVVGARVAGAATGMLLARAGLRVLVLERAAFPSDTVSSHQVQVPGIALLHRWGLLDGLRAAGTPATRRVRFDAGHTAFEGPLPSYGGVDALYSPRRTLLDARLADAARAAGAEVRERFRVTGLVWSEGRVTGVRGEGRGGAPVTERAPLVVGADGKHSLVAREAGARAYRTRPARAFASYSYWAGLPVTAGELYQRPGRTVAVFPTNDDLTMVYVAAPLTEFDALRGDLDGHVRRTADGCGDLGPRLRAAERAERLRTTPDQPNTLRVPHGPGWALAGDAGAVMDSITAQGITNALRDASLLADAVVRGLPGGPRRLDAALRARHRRRDAGLREMYDLTVGLAEFAPPGRLERRFLAAVAERPAEAERFLAAFTGAAPLRAYRARAAARLLLRRPRAGGGPPPATSAHRPAVPGSPSGGRT